VGAKKPRPRARPAPRPSSNIAGNSVSRPLTLTISRLAFGQPYESECWTNDPLIAGFLTTATAGNSITLSSNPSGLFGGVGQFAIGTSTADGPTEVITFTSPCRLLGINGLQLRAVPEHSTVTLLGLGILGLIGYRWGRRRKATATTDLAGVLRHLTARFDVPAAAPTSR
jgi:hypothetical protein